MAVRLVLRNLKQLKEGKYRFTLRWYDDKDVIIVESSHWILNAAKKLQAPAAFAHGKWFVHGELGESYKPFVMGALERAIDQVTTAVAKSDGLDRETVDRIWSSKEEHVIAFV